VVPPSRAPCQRGLGGGFWTRKGLSLCCACGEGEAGVTWLSLVAAASSAMIIVNGCRERGLFSPPN